MTEIRYVSLEDKDFWFGLDRHLSDEEFIAKVRNQRGYVIFEDHLPVGLMRYNLFWDNTPFCTLLYISHNKQGRGYGSLLMQRWENDMRIKGYSMLMVSTQVDEQAQHFYRKLGYKDCGGFVVDITGHEQPMEIIMIKGI